MPTLTRWIIRTSLLYLLAGMITGMLYWANVMWSLWRPLAALNPVYIHLLVVGWLTQLIYGVMYWMFPIINRDNMRGDPRLAWAAYIVLNAGLILRAVFEPLRVTDANEFNGAMLVLSSLLQAAAAWLMVIVIWRRVREKPGRSANAS